MPVKYIKYNGLMFIFSYNLHLIKSITTFFPLVANQKVAYNRAHCTLVLYEVLVLIKDKHVMKVGQLECNFNYKS